MWPAPCANAVTNLVEGGADAVLGPVSSTDARAAIPAVAGARLVGVLGDRPPSRISTADPPTAAFYRTALPGPVDGRVRGDGRSSPSATPSALGTPWKVVIVARGDDYGTSVSSGLSAILAAQGDGRRA